MLAATPMPRPASTHGSPAAARNGSRSARLYFGNEFCHRLLPTPRALAAACRQAGGAWGGLTLVTPSVGDAGLAKLDKLFDVLAEDSPGAEVVANDWGVLRMLAQRPRGLQPVLGRLMNKMLRDPRVAPQLEADAPSKEALRATQQAALTAPGYRQMLAALNVSDVEFDNVPQGIDIDFAGLALRPILHLPFACVSTGPACFFAGIHQPKRTKFTSATPCKRECLQFTAAMQDAAAQRQMPLIARGNTVFYRQGAELVEQGLAWAAKQRARVVVRQDPFAAVGWATDDLDLARAWWESKP